MTKQETLFLALLYRQMFLSIDRFSENEIEEYYTIFKENEKYYSYALHLLEIKVLNSQKAQKGFFLKQCVSTTDMLLLYFVLDKYLSALADKTILDRTTRGELWVFIRNVYSYLTHAKIPFYKEKYIDKVHYFGKNYFVPMQTFPIDALLKEMHCKDVLNAIQEYKGTPKYLIESYENGRDKTDSFFFFLIIKQLYYSILNYKKEGNNGFVTFYKEREKYYRFARDFSQAKNLGYGSEYDKDKGISQDPLIYTALEKYIQMIENQYIEYNYEETKNDLHTVYKLLEDKVRLYYKTNDFAVEYYSMKNEAKPISFFLKMYNYNYFLDRINRWY